MLQFSWYIGVKLIGIFPTVHDKNGDFLGIASVSIGRQTLLLLGHHCTATDGTSITVNHTTRVDWGKSVVTVIGPWLLSSPQRRKWQPYILHRNHKTVAFRWNSSSHKRSVLRNLEINMNTAQIYHHFLGETDSFCQFKSPLKGTTRTMRGRGVKYLDCLSLLIFIHLTLSPPSSFL